MSLFILGTTHVVIGISDESIELFSLEDEEVITWLDNTAFRCYGTSSVNIVTSDHSHSNACSLALFDGIGDLGTHRVLNANHTNTSQIINNLFLFLPVRFSIHMYLKERCMIIEFQRK